MRKNPPLDGARAYLLLGLRRGPASSWSLFAPRELGFCAARVPQACTKACVFVEAVSLRETSTSRRPVPQARPAVIFAQTRAAGLDRRDLRPDRPYPSAA